MNKKIIVFIAMVLVAVTFLTGEKAHASNEKKFVSEYKDVSWVVNKTTPTKNELIDFKAVNKNSKQVGGYTTNAKTIFNVQIKKDTKKTVRKKLGTPLKSIVKGKNSYSIEDEKFDMFLIDNSYVTVFYDTLDKNIVRGIYWMNESYELNKEGYYGTNNSKLASSNEEIMSILVNNFRTEKDQTNLKYNPTYNDIPRNHSADMIKNNYVSHTDSKGESPYSRVGKKLNILSAGENISYGQFNAFYMHESLVNSSDHRINMLLHDYENIIVGFDFGNKEPYITINFYSLELN